MTLRENSLTRYEPGVQTGITNLRFFRPSAFASILTWK
jgi:hypothetical protein